MKMMKKVLLVVAVLAIAGTRLFADTTNYTPLPGDGTTAEWCDIASELDQDKDGKTLPDTLRQRIELYNKKDDTASKCHFLLFFLFRNKDIVLKAPLVIENNPHDRTEGKGTPVNTGTYVTGYGPGGETDHEGINIDGRSVTKDGKTCAITIKGGFAAEQQIHGVTMTVTNANLAICDENGQDLMAAVSPFCSGKSGKDCDFKDVTVLSQSGGDGGGNPPTCDLTSGANTGLIITPGLAAERSILHPDITPLDPVVASTLSARLPVNVILGGGGYKLTWKTTNATTITLNDGKATKTVTATGSEVVDPAAQTTYTLAATGPDGECSDVVVITPPAPKPPTCAFTSKASDGGGFDLTWSSTDGTKETLTEGSSSSTVTASGNKHVAPDSATTYVLSVEGVSGLCSRSITLGGDARVAPSPAPVCDLTSVVSSGGGFDLSWTSSDGVMASLTDGSTVLSTDLNSTDPVHVDPSAPTLYSLTVNGPGGMCSSSVALVPAPAPTDPGTGGASGPTGASGPDASGSDKPPAAAAASQSCGLQLVAPPAEGATGVMPFLSLIFSTAILLWLRKGPKRE